jgi:hypothetical protein
LSDVYEDCAEGDHGGWDEEGFCGVEVRGTEGRWIEVETHRYHDAVENKKDDIEEEEDAS